MSEPAGYLAFLRQNAPFLGTGALLMLLSSFGQTFFISIFGGEIRETFGLSNGDWGLIYMAATMASALVVVWAGRLADAFRVRVLGAVVLAGLALSVAALGLVTGWIGLMLTVFGLRFFGQGMATHLSAVAMSRWFIATRGRALALAGLGFMVGEATLPLVMVWLKGHVDWRTIWLGSAVLVLCMIPVLVALLRLERTPQSVAAASPAAGRGGRHWTRSEVLRDPVFWLIVPTIMSFSAFGTAFWFHQVHFAEIKGWSHLGLVAVFPLGTAALAVSSIVFGWAIDRLGAVRLLPVYILPYAAAFVLHWFAPGLAWAALGVVLMGVSGGGHGTLLNACWAELYGTAHIGGIRSVATALMVLGSALGPGLSGVLIDAGVAYDLQMLGYAAVFALCAALMWLASRRVMGASAGLA